MEAAAEVPSLSLLYERHRVRALAIARRVLGDPDDAEDVVQDVFVRLFLRPDGYDGQSTYATWLHRVMVNSSINQLRSNKRRARLRDEPGHPPTPEQLAIGSEMERAFLAALERTTRRQRQVLWLREMRGFSYPEIAAMLRIPEGTVKSALNRGRATVMELLGGKHGEDTSA